MKKQGVLIRVWQQACIVAGSAVLLACVNTAQTSVDEVSVAEPVASSPVRAVENKTLISPSPDLASSSRFVLAARFGQESTVRYLLSEGASVDAKDTAGNTALIAAAANGQAELVGFLIGQGADINAVNKEKNSVLMGAATKGNDGLVLVLIEAEASIDTKNNQGETALFLAVQYGHLATARVLLKHGANPNIRNTRRVNDSDSGYTPLMYAVAGGLTHRETDWLAMAILLLDSGADPDLADRQGETALMLANARSDQGIAELLIQRGAKDDSSYMALAKDEALLKAIRLADEAKVAALLNTGAVSNHIDKNGVTPLLAAAHTGQLGVVKQLLTHQAEVNYVTSGLRQFALEKSHAPMRDRELMAVASRGDTALIAAARQGHAQVVVYLLEKGAQIDLPNRHGELPLFVVVERGYLALTTLFLERGASVDTLEQDNRSNRETLAQTNRGRNSVLIAAVEAKQFAVVQQLVAAGANLNYRGRRGKTALFSAAENLQIDVAQLLLDHHAKVDLASSAGITPLMMASKKGSAALVNMLISKGSEVNVLDTPDLGYPAKGLGMTALMFAARSGHHEVVEVLLHAGAAINIHNAKGKNALHEARDNGHNGLVKQLLAAGANDKVVLSGMSRFID